jgi:ectoine hydroxylase
MTDHYKSRLSSQELKIIERKDPVIYGKASSQNAAELEFFEANGYLKLENAIEKNNIERFLAAVKRYVEENPGREDIVYEEDQKTVRSLFALHLNLQKELKGLVTGPIHDLVESILGPENYLHQSRINFKKEFTGKGFSWHSDFETWHTEDGMPSMRCLSLVVALTSANPMSGPLMFIPRSHKYFVECGGESPEDNYKSSLINQVLGIPNENQLRELTDKFGAKMVDMNVGDILLFDCNLLHASSNNYSPYSRSLLYYVINNESNKLQDPFIERKPRPEHIGARKNIVSF